MPFGFPLGSITLNPKLYTYLAGHPCSIESEAARVQQEAADLPDPMDEEIVTQLHEA